MGDDEVPGTGSNCYRCPKAHWTITGSLLPASQVGRGGGGGGQTGLLLLLTRFPKQFILSHTLAPKQESQYYFPGQTQEEHKQHSGKGGLVNTAKKKQKQKKKKGKRLFQNKPRCYIGTA